MAIGVCRLIIKAGADVNVRDFDGWTPLHAAAHWGQKEAAEVLLENMCDISIKDTCVSFSMLNSCQLVHNYRGRNSLFHWMVCTGPDSIGCCGYSRASHVRKL